MKSFMILSLNYTVESIPSSKNDLLSKTWSKWISITFLFFELEAKNSEKICLDSLTLYAYNDDFTNQIAKFCGKSLNRKRIISNIETLVLTFSSDSLENELGFLAHLEFVDDFIPTENDIIIDEKSFIEDKQKFRKNFLATVTYPMFQTRGVKNELYHSELYECQMRNIFNSQRGIESENSCFNSSPKYDAWLSKNFDEQCGIQAIQVTLLNIFNEFG